MRRYFGTDGLRARVGFVPMVPELILKLGWAVGQSLPGDHHKKVLVGKDTRVSGYMFESALQAGLSAAGVDIGLLGPLPTPGVAHLTRTLHADAGIVISASHNPYYDNGIKLFSAKGRKLSDDEELRIEGYVDKELVTADQLGKAKRIDDAQGRYAEFCKHSVDEQTDFRGIRIVVDCANGAGYQVAPHVFEELGATVYTIGNNPDGFNINHNCGTLYPDVLREEVLKQGADLGVAIDGDGDRLVMADEKGQVFDGDELLLIIVDARTPKPVGIVGTLMSNLGLEHELQRRGIDFHRAQVGDRYIIQALDEKGWMLGSEPSGHIICLDTLPTGDAIVAALQVVSALSRQGKTLSEFKTLMTKYPQVLINVEATGTLADYPALNKAVAAAEQALGDRGRVVVRPSGTESLIRVMVEAETEEISDYWANEIAAALSASATVSGT